MHTNNTVSPILLLVDDDVDVLNALQRALRQLPVEIKTFSSAVEAVKYCESNQPDVVISDQKMPEMDGCEFLSLVMKLWPNSRRIILSAYQDFQKVSTAFNSGVVERFICKPWDTKELKFIIEKALEQPSDQIIAQKKHENNTLAGPISFHKIIAADETMHDLFNSIKHAATTNAPIFITGETGTGKELVAKACHSESYHNEQPFIAVNCANFSENLIESQLFGHTKGAFTGAISNQEGLFSAAKKGTLFLDEITTLSKPLQAKLLRVIQEREFSPLGTNKVEKFHAQIVSASSNSISKAVVEGDFREDLFYRLNVITLSLPPLRERGSDLLHIARFFLKKYSKIENRTFSKFSRDAIQIIYGYDWPGNVRQLENVIHGMVILNTGPQITSEMMIKSLSTTANVFFKQPSKPVVDIESTDNNSPRSNNKQEIIPLWLVEKNTIESAISFCDGNIPKAAALLEVSPSTIYRKKLSW